jgi:hypothetical protein
MRERKRWMLGAVLLVAMALLLLPAIVLAGQDSSQPARSDQAKAGSASVRAEKLRLERRESFRHTGCSKRAHGFTDSSV